MKCKSAALLAILFLVSARGSDTQPATFRAVPHWKKGDVFRFDTSKLDVKTGEDGQAQRTKFQYTTVIQVVDGDKDGYLLDCHLTDVRMIDPPDPTGLAAKLTAALGEKVLVRFRVDASGLSNGKIENWEQVRTATLQVIDMGQEGKSEAARKEAHDQFAQFLEDPKNRDAMEATVLQEPAMLVSLHGADFSTSPKVIPASLVTPIGPDKLPATTTRLLEKETDSEAVVKQTTECGKDALPAMKAVLEKASGKEVDIPPDAAFECKIVVDATFDRASGFATQLRYSRIAHIQGISQETTIEYKPSATATHASPDESKPPR